MSENSSKYSILILINVRWWNATAFYAVNIARILHKNKHKVIVGCNSNYPAYGIARSYGLQVVPLNFFGYNIFSLLKDFIRMLALIRREKIQFINSHRSEDHTFALLARGFTRIKVILTRGDRRKISANFFSRVRYRLADALILTCHSILDQNKKAFRGNKNIVRVIYGSIDESRFKPARPKEKTAKKYKVDLRNKIIGIAGRTDYVKDQYTFVKAAFLTSKKIKNVFFIIAGKEEHIKFAGLRKMIKALEMEKKFLLLPIVDDIAGLIDLFDLGVITSVDSETISRVLLEYMALKKPVIGTKVNAIGEIIKPGTNGELFRPRGHEELALKMIKILNNGPLAKRYGENSYHLYNKYYSEEVFYKQYIEIFDRLKL